LTRAAFENVPTGRFQWIAWAKKRWLATDLAAPQLHDGRTPSLVLAAWALGPSLMKRCAAAADPSTPQWALNRLAAQQIEVAGRVDFVPEGQTDLIAALLTNPELSADTLERMIEPLLSPRPHRYAQYQSFQSRWSELILQHPNVSPSRLQRIIDGSLVDAGFSALGEELGKTIEMRESLNGPTLIGIGHDARCVLHAAHHLHLSDSNIEQLFTRLTRCLAAFVACCDKFRAAHGTRALERSPAFQKVGTLVGTAVALLATHPLASDVQRQFILQPLSAEGQSIAWIHIIEAMEWIEETSPHLVSLVCEARAPEGFVPPMDSPSIVEISAWGSVLRGLAQADPQPSDAKTIAAAFRRDEVIVSHALGLPDFIERIYWTKALVRACLLSQRKELRELGLKGAAALGNRAQSTDGEEANSTLAVVSSVDLAQGGAHQEVVADDVDHEKTASSRVEVLETKPGKSQSVPRRSSGL